MNEAIKLPADLTIESAAPLSTLLSEAHGKSLPLRFSPDGGIDLAGVQLLLAYQRKGHTDWLTDAAWPVPDHVLQALKLAGGLDVMKISKNKRMQTT